MSAAHWDDEYRSKGRAAVWSEPDYEASIELSIAAIKDGEFGMFLDSGDGMTVLEIGCGIGRVTTAMAARHPSFAFYGQDISPAMIEAAIDNSTVQNIAWWMHDTELPSDVDAVYSMLVFQHLDGATVRNYFHRISKALRPAGMFRFQFVEGDYHGDHDHRYAIDDVRDSLRDAGFALTSITSGLMHDEWVWVTAVKL